MPLTNIAIKLSSPAGTRQSPGSATGATAQRARGSQGKAAPPNPPGTWKQTLPTSAVTLVEALCEPDPLFGWLPEDAILFERAGIPLPAALKRGRDGKERE